MEIEPKNVVRGLFKTLSLLILIGIVGGGALGAYFVYSITQGLPPVSTLKQIQLSHATEVFSEDGRKIGEFSTEHRYSVRFESIPKHVIYAFVAAEDSKFFEHHGIDVVGIGRAFLLNVFRGKFAQGASTITQQVARGLLLATRKKEITRKIKEMVLARRMEEELSKAEILNLYLSDIYLGHGAFGVGAAAENYFHKKIEDLTLAEAALLAGLPQRPNDWDPFHNPYSAKKRQQYVLKRMVEDKYVSLEDAKTALHQPLKLYRLEDLNNSAAPYFTEYVRSYLMNKYGADKVLSEGFKVYTTVRFSAQKAAEKSVLTGVRSVDKRLGWRGALAHLESKAQIDQFLTNTHDEVMEKVAPERLLNYDVDPKTKKLAYDLASFQGPNSRYYGPTPVAEGEIYSGLVTQVGDASALIRIGQTSVLLPVSGMNWVKVKGMPAKRVDAVLKAGDVVQTRIAQIDRARNLVTASLEQEPEIQGALLSYDLQNGYVRAMVGGLDFNKNKFNIAIQAKRQVGSTFKPIVYAAALDKGYSPSSVVTDSPIVFKVEGAADVDNPSMPWRPHNYGGKFEGEIPLRMALIHSMNVPTIKITDQIGVDYAIQYARRLGITAALPRDLTIGLGSVATSLEEMMRAYAVFPRLGRPIQLTYITKVVDSSGKTLEEAPLAPPPAPVNEPGLNPGEVISPQTAYVMTDMLRGVVREGTGSAASVVPAAVAGKTGTSNNHRDAWFIGYTPHVMSGVWIGYKDDKPLDPAETGGKAAAPVWADFMQAMVRNYPKTDFVIPDNVVFAYIDKRTGKLANAQTAKRVRVAFKIGTVPNINGDNLPRIGEPGMGHPSSPGLASTPVTPATPAAGAIAPARPKVEPTKGETSDFLRQGYGD